MKKNYFFTALALCGLLTFTSCGNDDDPISEGPNTEIAAGDQVIVLDMQDTDVLSTKSRPLYSTDSKGAKEVTDVMLYIFQKGKDNNDQTLVRTIYVPNWNVNPEKYQHGYKKTIKLNAADGAYKKLGDGTYTIYAVGQNETSMTPAPFKFYGKDGNTNAFYSIPELGKDAGDVQTGPTHNFATTPGDGFSYLLTKAVSYKGDADAFASRAVGEVFSGQSQPVTLEASEGFSATVLLKRQVAGVLGYFEMIPADGNNGKQEACISTKLRLVASDRNDRLDMTIQLDKQNDDATDVGKENIVNGFKDATQDNNPKDAQFKGGADKNAYTVYEIDLKDWFTWDDATGWKDLETVDTKSYLGKTSGWKNAFETTNADVTVADGAVLAGEFVIPFDKVESNPTFELQLIGKKKGNGGGTALDGTDNNEYILQTWSVKLDNESLDAQLGDTKTHYSIYRNHLYQIGKRGGGDNPDKPGKDPDKPQPLDKSQELVIKINDQWEHIHDMEID